MENIFTTDKISGKKE